MAGIKAKCLSSWMCSLTVDFSFGFCRSWHSMKRLNLDWRVVDEASNIRRDRILKKWCHCEYRMLKKKCHLWYIWTSFLITIVASTVYPHVFFFLLLWNSDSSGNFTCIWQEYSPKYIALHWEFVPVQLNLCFRSVYCSTNCLWVLQLFWKQISNKHFVIRINIVDKQNIYIYIYITAPKHSITSYLYFKML